MQLTQGQPWLVNALAKVAVEEISSNLSQAITVSIISQAKEELIRRQDTHLDSLAERLREPRVRSIIEPILSGQALGNVPPDDLRFVQDLGLVRLEPCLLYTSTAMPFPTEEATPPVIKIYFVIVALTPF